MYLSDVNGRMEGCMVGIVDYVTCNLSIPETLGQIRGVTLFQGMKFY